MTIAAADRNVNDGNWRNATGGKCYRKAGSLRRWSVALPLLSADTLAAMKDVRLFRLLAASAVFAFLFTSGATGVQRTSHAGRPFTIAKVGRTLFATLPTGVANVPLFETPGGGLVGPGGEFVYSFERDSNGRATTVTMTRYGKTVWRAKRAD
jgi:hypothetical protein